MLTTKNSEESRLVLLSSLKIPPLNRTHTGTLSQELYHGLLETHIDQTNGRKRTANCRDVGWVGISYANVETLG